MAVGKNVQEPINIGKSILKKMTGELHGSFRGNFMRRYCCRNGFDTGHTLFHSRCFIMYNYVSPSN